MKHKTSQHQYATMDDDLVREVVLGLSGEMSLGDARNKLHQIRRDFVICRELRQVGYDDELALWIRGLTVSEQDQKNGFLGQFAKLSVASTDSGNYIITTTVLTKPLREHPFCDRTTRRYPNTGHPIMRAMERNKLFRSKQEVINLFDKMQKEYPATTIRLAPEALRTMIYSVRHKRSDTKSPVQSWYFYIDDCQGGYMIRGDNAHNTRGNVDAARIKKGEAIGSAASRRVDEIMFSKASMVAFILGDMDVTVV